MKPVDSKGSSPNDGMNSPYACPLCGGTQISTVLHRDTFTYGSGESAATLRCELPVRHCAACDIEFVDHEGERIRHEAVCRHLGVLTPAEIRAIRSRHGMTRTVFAQITGLGEATLNRWENGIVVQNLANDRYLRLLSMPGVIHTLRTTLDSPTSLSHESPSVGRSRFRVLEVSDRMLVRQCSFQLRLAS